MLPLRINLLSPDKQLHLAKMSQVQFLRSIFEMLLVVFSIVGITLLGSQHVLQNYFSQLTESMLSVNSEHSEEIREIIHINKTLTHISSIQTQVFAWTPLLSELTNATPAGITLNDLEVDQKNKQIRISGHASTREIFLDYQDKLKQIPYTKDVSSPLSDLTNIENFSFTLSITMH